MRALLFMLLRLWRLLGWHGNMVAQDHGCFNVDPAIYMPRLSVETCQPEYWVKIKSRY